MLRWNSAAPVEQPDFLDYLNLLRSRSNWIHQTLKYSADYLGLVSGRFRIEYATELIHDREDSLWRTTFVKFAAASMMIFGLGGTFYAFIDLISHSGLIEALQTISENGNQAKLYAELTSAFLKVYVGFGAAFGASLAGLGTTVFLVFVNQLFVENARARFMLSWASIAHEWEGRFIAKLQAADYQSESPTLEEAQPAKTTETTPEKVADTIQSMEALLVSNAATQERWEVLVRALQESQSYFNKAIEAVAREGETQRGQTQILVADVVVAMRQVVTELGNKIAEVSAAKVENIKQTEESLSQHFENSKHIWEKKLQQSLDEFSKTAAQAVIGAHSALTESREEALKAGERVANAVRQEAQEALASFSQLLNITATNQKSLEQSFSENQIQSQAVVKTIQENKESHEQYINELTHSLKAWKNAPKSIDNTLKNLDDSAIKLAEALIQTAQMPSRWEAEIRGLSDILQEAAERRREDSAWHQIQSGVKKSSEKVTNWFRNLNKSQ